MMHPARTPLVLATLGVGLALLLAFPEPSRAQQPAPAQGSAAAAQGKGGEEAAGQPAGAPRARGARAEGGGGKIIVLDEEIIEGRIQKPEAFYILQRSNLNYKSLELQRSFVPDIVKTVKDKPF